MTSRITITFEEFIAQVEARKRELGMSDDPDTIEAMRNKGGNRTPEKRELLRRARQRAKECGITPAVISYFEKETTQPGRGTQT